MRKRDGEEEDEEEKEKEEKEERERKRTDRAEQLLQLMQVLTAFSKWTHLGASALTKTLSLDTTRYHHSAWHIAS
jgi:hypothetical protein